MSFNDFDDIEEAFPTGDNNDDNEEIKVKILNFISG